ncbi:MAG: hypothetical protein ACREEW_17945, partial [Caulobacteraceae bacterium]
MTAIDPQEGKQRVADMIAEARRRVAVLTGSLPKVVDPAGISLTAKLPFLAVCFRESMIWRAEETGRGACAAFEAGDLVNATLLVRGFIETTGAVWYLMDFLKRQNKNGLTPNAGETVRRLLLGNRRVDEAPNPIHVMDFVRQVEATIPGFAHSYDALCELAHPNWAGAL